MKKKIKDLNYEERKKICDRYWKCEKTCPFFVNNGTDDCVHHLLTDFIEDYLEEEIEVEEE